MIDTMNSSAAQWWIWRMIRPPRTSKEMFSVGAVGLGHHDALAAARRSRRTATRPELGTNQNVRNVPVSSRMTSEYIAISPSMKDQWSGKTFFSR